MGAGILLALGLGACGTPPNGPPPSGDDLIVDVTLAQSSCNADGCTGRITFTVTNDTPDATTVAPLPTVGPDEGTAVRDVAFSTCNDGPLDSGDTCVERFDLADDPDAPLTGTISVDAGNVEGGTTYSA